MRICSYNVLATCHIKPEYYPSVAPRFLDPVWRTAALIRRMLVLDADVFCLQEVEPDAFVAFEAALTEHHGVFVQKGEGKYDGCATFLRRSLEASRTEAHHFEDGTGHLVLVRAADGISIANTHLKWGADSLVSLGEMRELLALAPDVICGDLNVVESSTTVAAALDAGYRDAYALRPQATANPNGRKKRIDFILSRAPAEPEPIPTIDDATPLPSAQEPSDHLPIIASLCD